MTITLAQPHSDGRAQKCAAIRAMLLQGDPDLPTPSDDDIERLAYELLLIIRAKGWNPFESGSYIKAARLLRLLARKGGAE